MGHGAFRLAVFLTMGVGAPVLLACSSSSVGSTVVTGSDLATSCAVDDDCLKVYFGDVCGSCTADFPNAAIASSAEAEYQNALRAAERRCPPTRLNGICAVAPPSITTCARGTCTFTTCPGAAAGDHACAPTNDAGPNDAGATVVTESGFATSCAVDDDCVGAYFGDVCGFCTTNLPNAAIAASAQAAYQQALTAAESRCPPSMINGLCANPATITTCATGTCKLTTCAGPPVSAHACTNDTGTTVVSGSGLATGCSVDSDCVGAYFGDVCGLCATAVPNAAIAINEQAAYQSALNLAESRCPPSTIAGSCVADRTITTCAMGTCTVTTCPGFPADAHTCASTTDAGVK